MVNLLHGDCLDVLKTLDDCSIDSIVTDPPYGLSFMGKKWDYDVPSADVWRECLRALKPGGYLLSFAGTRTQHRMACNIEDAGFEIRDMIAWVYGSGFPKSLDVSKAIDKAAGVEREVVGIDPARFARLKNQINGSVSTGEQWEHGGRDVTITAPATDAARQWQGWGTALKPALEPITVARKPLAGTVVANVLAHGTGAINIDGCRVPGTEDTARPQGKDINGGNWSGDGGRSELITGGGTGRWPANFIHSGEDEVLALFPVTSPSRAGVRDPNGTMGYHGGASGLPDVVSGHNDNGGSAARFFYCAKASKRDRDEGLDGRNTHNTVKPTNLMQYLCRLVTPPNGVILDPFMGSGSTGKAAVLEGFSFVGIEREAEYLEIAKARIAHVSP